MSPLPQFETRHITTVPIFAVNVYIQYRFLWKTVPFLFTHSHSPVEYQLDAEFLRVGKDNPRVVEDAIGIVVDGMLFTNDAPYWLGLLRQRQVVQVAYLKRPNPSSRTRLWDYTFSTPLMDRVSIPAFSDDFTTSAANRALESQGFLEERDQSGPLEQWRGWEEWTKRGEDEIREALVGGRGLDAERMGRFNAREWESVMRRAKER